MFMDVKMFRMELVLEAKDSGMMLVIMTTTLGEVAGKMYIPQSYQLPSLLMGLIPSNRTSETGILLIKAANNFLPSLTLATT